MAEPRRRTTRKVFDEIDALALAFLALGGLLMVWGTVLSPPAGAGGFFLLHFTNWAPGLATDGLLLLVLNHILRRHERRRVIAQVASLSNEFALDAVRRMRQEGWHADGSLEGEDLRRARLVDSDLSEARLARADLTAADLRGAALHHADLTEADLTAANLRGADLRWCQLNGARLRRADLRDALLDGTNVSGADLRGAALDPGAARRLGCAEDASEPVLSDREAALLKESMNRLRALGTEPAEDFYRRLFDAEPRLRGLFRSEPEHQARKFLHSLAMVVEALDEPNRHMPVLQKLGARHAGYGVRPEHFDLVTRLLVDVLEAHLGPRFTPEVRGAWKRGLAFIAAAMIEAGEESGKPAAPPVLAAGQATA